MARNAVLAEYGSGARVVGLLCETPFAVKHGYSKSHATAGLAGESVHPRRLVSMIDGSRAVATIAGSRLRSSVGLERRPVTSEVAGSSPVSRATETPGHKPLKAGLSEQLGPALFCKVSRDVDVVMTLRCDIVRLVFKTVIAAWCWLSQSCAYTLKELPRVEK